jgi:hypothetical protein
MKVPVGHEVTPLTRVGEVTDTPAAMQDLLLRDWVPAGGLPGEEAGRLGDRQARAVP